MVSDVDAGALDALVAEMGDDVAVAAVADVTDSGQVRAAVELAVEPARRSPSTAG